MKKIILFPLFLLLFISVSSAQDTLTLLYNINESKLSSEKMSQLSKITDKDHIHKVQIIGYTDYLGSKEYNLSLSKKRANAVQRFFEKKNIKVESCQGKGITGKTLDSKKGIHENRKVEIIYFIGETITPKEEITDIKSMDSLKIDMDEIEVGDKLVLKNFNFIPGRHYLVAESKPELARLIDIMLANPTLKIELQGHICCETEQADGWDRDELNYKLSHNRAKYIHDQLVRFGVSPDRLSYKGFGRKNPLFPLELSEQEQAANRRVEILIIEK